MKYTRISEFEREKILAGLSRGMTISKIASDLNRNVSSISREVQRNTHDDCDGYSPSQAERRARSLAANSHCRSHKLEVGSPLYVEVYSKLRLRWSPKQISIWLKEEWPHNSNMQVSSETIYSFIYVQARSELKKELIRYLREKKKNRKPKTGRGEKRGRISEMISIRQRPEEVRDRSVPGHWEGDLIIGQHHKSAIGTLVERTTRFVVLMKLKGRDAETVRKTFAKRMTQFPSFLRKSMTYDQGKEMAEHKEFTMNTNVQVYFCDPASPWQRGTNENTNRLVRDFFDGEKDFTKISPQKLRWIQDALNERPRETLGWATPKERMEKLLLIP